MARKAIETRGSMTEEQAERLINAIESLDDTINRSIQHESALTGILTRSEEMRSLKKEKVETIRGTERSNKKALQLFKEVS